MQELFDRIIYRLAKEIDGDHDEEMMIALLDEGRSFVKDEEIAGKANGAIHAYYGYDTDDEKESN